MYIVGFSGPPHSGKDSIAKAVQQITMASPFGIDTNVMSLAWSMREMGMNFLGLDPRDDAAYAAAKATRQKLFERAPEALTPGTSYERDDLRQFMIWLAEDCLRKRYGRDFFGRKLIEDSGYQPRERGLLLVPDIGFADEVQSFERWLGLSNVLIVQLQRNDCNFSIDSRSYVGTDGKNFALENNSTIEWAAMQVVSKMINIGWTLEG